MTKLVDELEALAKNATPINGEIKLRGDVDDERYDVLGSPCGLPIAAFGDFNDAHFYVALRNAVPAIIAALRQPDAVPRDVAESWKAKAENYQKEREELLADISDMMANHVDNWPAPKKLKTAIALIGKTLDAMVPRHRQPGAVPGELVERAWKLSDIADLLDDLAEEQITYFLRGDSAERAKCKWCEQEAFTRSGIPHRDEGCLTRRIEKALAAIQSLTTERDAALARVAELEAGLGVAWDFAKHMRNSSKVVGPYPHDQKANTAWARSMYHAGKDLMEALKPARALLEGSKP